MKPLHKNFESIVPQSQNKTATPQIGVGTFKITDSAISYINSVLRSERLSYGPFLQEFENRFAQAHGCRFAVMTNSGTSSLMIALHALKMKYGWRDGDEVIVPAVTFVATANVVLQLNLKPVFVDVDPVYYELDPALLEKAITPKTRCILPVHLFGCPADMTPILQIAEAHKLRIIEDSCETMFSKYEGTSVGAFGDIGCFSTYVAHILCTGVGGLCTTNDPNLAISLRSLANHGRDSIYLSIDDDKEQSAENLKMIIQRRFSFIEPGYSFRVTELEGALGLSEIERSDEILARRRENGAFFINALRPLQNQMQLPSLRPNADHAFMMFPVVLKDERKVELVNYLEKNRIETRDMLPLVNQPIYQRLLGTVESDYPVARWINQNGFYFGCHQDLTSNEREYIVETITNYFKRIPVRESKSSVIVMSNTQSTENMLHFQSLITNLRDCGFDDYLLAQAGNNSELTSFFSREGFRIVSGSTKKGELLRAAIEESIGNYIVVVGIDGSDSIRDCSAILASLKRGNQMVVASRFAPGASREINRPFSVRSIGNRLLSFLTSVAFGKNVTDCINGFRGFRREIFSKIELHSKGPEVMAELTFAALKSGISYSEEPTHERKSAITYRKTNRPLNAFRTLLLLTRRLIET